MSTSNLIPPNAAGQPPYDVPAPLPDVPTGPDASEVPPEVLPGDDVDPAGLPDGTELDNPIDGVRDVQR